MKQKRQKKVSGFTLIELLVVIAIITILVSMLMPALSKARDKSKSIKCLANLKQMGTALGMYINDNSDYVPTVQQESSAGAGTYKAWFTRDVLGQYVGYKGRIVTSAASIKWQGTVYQCPSNALGTVAPASGSATTNYGFNNMTGGLGGNNSIFVPFLKVGMVAPDTFVIADTGPVSNNANGCVFLGYGAWTSYGMWGFYPLHYQGANFLSISGAAKHYSQREIYTTKDQPTEPKMTRFKD